MQCLENALAYFDTSVSYTNKIFIKSTPVVDFINILQV